MLETQRGEDGRAWVKGNTYPASTSFARSMVGRGFAYAPNGEVGDAQFSASEASALKASVLGAWTASAGMRTVLFGHSYMAQETGGDPVLDKFDNFQVLGTVVLANALMGCPMRIIKNVAAGGRRVLDMLPRYAKEVAPLRPKMVFVNIGHNDIKGLYSGFSDQIAVGPSEQQRELEYLHGRITEWLRNDVAPTTTVVFMGETPPGADTAGTVSANNHINLSLRYEKWNRMLSNFCTALGFNNVVYVPIDRATVDPTSLTMKNKAGHYYDTVHPGIAGAFARAKMLVKHLERLLPLHTDALPTWAGDSYTASKIALTARPVFDGSGTVQVLFDNAKGAVDWRKIEVGEWVTLMIPHSTNSTKGGRYKVIAADDTGATLEVPPSLTGVVTVDGSYISNCTQLLSNPLFLTTTGGQAVVSGVAGTITGDVPLNVDIANVPATHTVAVSTTPHTNRDGSAGYGNWMRLAITVAGAAAGAASTFEVRFRAAATSPVNAAYDNDRKVTVGQTVRFGLEVKQESALGGFAGFSAEVQGNVTDPNGSSNAVTYKAIALYRDTNKVPLTTSHPWPAEDMTLTLVTPEMAFEAGADKASRIATNADGRLFVNFVGNGSVNLYLGRVGVMCVDYPIEATLINTAAGV